MVTLFPGKINCDMVGCSLTFAKLEWRWCGFYLWCFQSWNEKVFSSPRTLAVLSSFCLISLLLTILLQVTVCLCGRDTCNGPSLPPREMIEENHDIIDIDEVFKGLQEQQHQVVKPEPVSSGAGAGGPRTLELSPSVILPSVILSIAKLCLQREFKQRGWG